MSKKPTTADAQLILQLYDLRREAEMRKARDWWVGEFFPAERRRLSESRRGPMGTPENAWLRQVGGYWSMARIVCAAGRAERRNVSAARQSAAKCFYLLAKVHPFLKELREKLGRSRTSFGNIEKVVTRYQVWAGNG